MAPEVRRQAVPAPAPAPAASASAAPAAAARLRQRQPSAAACLRRWASASPQRQRHGAASGRGHECPAVTIASGWHTVAIASARAGRAVCRSSCRAGSCLWAAASGYVFTLDAAVAAERLLGLAVTSLLAVVAMVGCGGWSSPSGASWCAVGRRVAGRGVGDRGHRARTPFGARSGLGLQFVFRPMFGLVRRHGLRRGHQHALHRRLQRTGRPVPGGDLCCGALLIARPRPARAGVAAGGRIAVALILLVGTGARGGLTGLAAGRLHDRPVRLAATVCAAALVAAPVGLVVAAAAFSTRASSSAPPPGG